jgi:hypothetical protein
VVAFHDEKRCDGKQFVGVQFIRLVDVISRTLRDFGGAGG